MGKSWKFRFWQIFRVIFLGVFISLILKLFVFEKYKIFSVSMLPTMSSEEWDFVTKFDYGYSRYSFPFNISFLEGVRLFPKQPQRGDIIVFRSNHPKARWAFVKRLIGLPNDKIKLENGRLYINGEIVPRTYVGKYSYTDRRNKTFNFSHYKETLPNGVTHSIIEISDDKFLDNIEEFQVPEGYYFFMGDNRDQSEDSRGGLGLIPFENLIGQIRKK